MSHNHVHSCECNHEEVKFCQKCKVVHCLNCNQEWSNRQTYWYYGSLTPRYDTTTPPYNKLLQGETLCENINGPSIIIGDTVANGNIQGESTKQFNPHTHEITCTHGEN